MASCHGRAAAALQCSNHIRSSINCYSIASSSEIHTESKSDFQFDIVIGFVSLLFFSLWGCLPSQSVSKNKIPIPHFDLLYSKVNVEFQNIPKNDSLA